MPASLPGSTLVENQANPSVGRPVHFSAFSGPKGSPLDAKKADYSNPASMTRLADPLNCSTGAESTGIGFGLAAKTPGTLIPQPYFTDDYQPGITLPSGVAATTAILTAIGGGRVVVSGAGQNIYTVTPYAAQPLLGAGNGGTRDAGAGPAFTGFGSKLVTAIADIANGVTIEAGWLNRQGATLKSGLSQFGSSNTASPAVT